MTTAKDKLTTDDAVMTEPPVPPPRAKRFLFDDFDAQNPHPLLRFFAKLTCTEMCFTEVSPLVYSKKALTAQ